MSVLSKATSTQAVGRLSRRGSSSIQFELCLASHEESNLPSARSVCTLLLTTCQTLAYLFALTGFGSCVADVEPC